MEEAADLCGANVHAEFTGDGSSNLCRFNRVQQDVLTKRGAPLQPTEDAQQLCRNTGHTNLECGGLTVLERVSINFTLRLRNNLFDANRMNSPVLHEALKGDTRHLATNWVKR